MRLFIFLAMIFFGNNAVFSQVPPEFQKLDELKKIVPKSRYQQASIQKLIAEEEERLRRLGKLKDYVPSQSNTANTTSMPAPSTQNK